MVISVAMEPVAPVRCLQPVTTRCVALASPTTPKWQVNNLYCRFTRREFVTRIRFRYPTLGITTGRET